MCIRDRVYKDLALEVLETHKEAKYFHIGGDEAWHRGSCPACRKAAGRKGKDKFYIDYVSGICDLINQNGKTPIIWDDCFRKASPAELKKISSKAVLMYWKYGTTTEGKEEVQYPSLQLYKKAGVRLAGASAVSGADGMNATCVNHKRRLENNLSWARVAKKYHMLGVAGTAWTRYCGTLPPAEAIETAWMPVLAEAEFLWKVPAGNNFNDYSRRFVKRFYGIDSDELVKAHYLIDKSNQKAFEAREIFKKFKSKAKKNREILGLMEVSCEIIELNEHFKYVIETIIESDWYRNRHYVLWKQEKKDKLLELAEAKKIITGIKRRAFEVYSKFLKKAEAEEFVLSRFALEEKKIDEYSIFLRKTKAK